MLTKKRRDQCISTALAAVLALTSVGCSFAESKGDTGTVTTVESTNSLSEDYPDFHFLLSMPASVIQSE